MSHERDEVNNPWLVLGLDAEAVNKAIAVLRNAAETQRVPGNQVFAALRQLEKAKLPVCLLINPPWTFSDLPKISDVQGTAEVKVAVAIECFPSWRGWSAGALLARWLQWHASNYPRQLYTSLQL